MMKRFIAAILTVLIICSAFGGMTVSAADRAEDVKSVSSLLKTSLEGVKSEVNIASYEITIAKFKTILNDVLDDNPQIYYLKQYSCKGNGTTSVVTSVSFTYKISASQVKSQASEIATELRRLRAKLCQA